MLTKYFKEFEKSFSKKTSAKKAQHDIKAFREMLLKILPVGLDLDTIRPIDSSGFSPDGADLIAYKKSCPDITAIMSGFVPYELVHGTFFVVPHLDKPSLADVLTKVSSVKKLSHFVEKKEEETAAATIPSFIIVHDSDYDILNLKTDIINFYMAKSIDHKLEFDLLVLPNRGMVIKNWNEKRSFIGLETGEDSMMWFFILMTEYMEIEKTKSLDLRDYVKKDVVYTEY